jgi:hypothetical protein
VHHTCHIELPSHAAREGASTAPAAVRKVRRECRPQCSHAATGTLWSSDQAGLTCETWRSDSAAKEEPANPQSASQHNHQTQPRWPTRPQLHHTRRIRARSTQSTNIRSRSGRPSLIRREPAAPEDLPRHRSVSRVRMRFPKNIPPLGVRRRTAQSFAMPAFLLARFLVRLPPGAEEESKSNVSKTQIQYQQAQRMGSMFLRTFWFLRIVGCAGTDRRAAVISPYNGTAPCIHSRQSIGPRIDRDQRPQDK